jgi:hypothetical protein
LLKFGSLKESERVCFDVDDSVTIMDEMTLTGTQRKEDWIKNKLHWNEKTDCEEKMEIKQTFFEE